MNWSWFSTMCVDHVNHITSGNLINQIIFFFFHISVCAVSYCSAHWSPPWRIFSVLILLFVIDSFRHSIKIIKLRAKKKKENTQFDSKEIPKLEWKWRKKINKWKITIIVSDSDSSQARLLTVTSSHTYRPHMKPYFSKLRSSIHFFFLFLFFSFFGRKLILLCSILLWSSNRIESYQILWQWQVNLK